ncbi:MAG: aminopeptidase P family protein [Lentisphaeria bacterium]|nr:aminopeptidase P family protein [Lentisphaerota bacterium]MBR7145099.1 aminopeptidase P family protein [Lentisphaeria bacterium]
MAYVIPKNEYFERIAKFQANIKAAGLDACLVHGTESDFANVRYLSEYWPTFEQAGVFVPAEGDAVLLIGPESYKYAVGRSVLSKVALMLNYRESAEPDYPGIDLATYPEVVKMAMGNKKLKKLGLVGTAVMTKPTLDAVANQLPGVEVVVADDVFRELRWVKSENELNCHRKAFKVAEKAVAAMLNELKPGMTEFQAIGIAQREIYANGGEYEGHSLYCFGGDRTSNGISRPTGAKLKKNEIIQLNIGARVGGYSSSIGIPVYFGKLPKEQMALVEFGLRAHKYTFELMKAGVEASSIAQDYYDWGCAEGWKDYMLYGPVHGLGIMETESPWIETTSKYKLKENMTYQIDTFFTGNGYGLRWERGCIITKDGCELLSKKFMSLKDCKLD